MRFQLPGITICPNHYGYLKSKVGGSGYFLKAYGVSSQSLFGQGPGQDLDSRGGWHKSRNRKGPPHDFVWGWTSLAGWVDVE